MDALIELRNVNYSFGQGTLRKQILFDITHDIYSGEIIIVTGPSGSGKTTLLTLIGALRSAQEGSIRVLGQELNGAHAKALTQVRKRIGYIFQAHNLLRSLTAVQNVAMGLRLHPDLSRKQVHHRAGEMLEAVGLGDRLHHHPHEMSGGQKQRVAIARALAPKPQIILADEPTASLDKQSGRDVVELMQALARRQGVTVLLVTHDNRILDVADHIIHLEDGRLTSFTNAVLTNTQHMMGMLALNNRKGQLTRYVKDLSGEQFVQLLAEATSECQRFLQAVDVSRNEAFQSMLEQLIEALTLKIGELLGADRVSLFLVDARKGDLFSKVAQTSGEKALEIRMPLGSGIAGRVAMTGVSMNIPDAYADALFNRAVDEETGYHTRSILCVPIADDRGRVIAVAQLLNKVGGQPFQADDELRLREFSASLGVVLQSWWQLSQNGNPKE